MDVSERYFKWLCRFIYDGRYSSIRSYDKLLRHLFDTDFYWILAFDQNRAEDGISLRFRFQDEVAMDNYILYTRNEPSSILEMMVALALRCEEFIMTDDDVGDRTGQWFWAMIVSLGLGGMTDENYNESNVDRILNRFLNRTYEPSGNGGLFTVSRREDDMRDVEILYQLCWYLDEVLTGV